MKKTFSATFTQVQWADDNNFQWSSISCYFPCQPLWFIFNRLQNELSAGSAIKANKNFWLDESNHISELARPIVIYKNVGSQYRWVAKRVLGPYSIMAHFLATVWVKMFFLVIETCIPLEMNFDADESLQRNYVL